VGHCRDCGEWDDCLKNSLCPRCGELRKFLSNPNPCGCRGGNRWRYRDGGFAWHCGNCELHKAPDNAVWYRAHHQFPGYGI
jgi:hypothetical protein